MNTKFIAEVSSNHNKNLERCIEFIRTSASIDCDAVKFQLFKVEELFSPEILQRSKLHRARKEWQLPLEFIPELRKAADDNNIEFSCTPFYLDAVQLLAPHVHFLKIASYEILWTDLLIECAKTYLPIVISSGMATLDEIDNAIETLKRHGANDITLLHCVSAYPTPENQCNLAVLESFRQRYQIKVGWSDHSVSTAVLTRAIHHWNADVIEFHIDLDEQGEEYAAGHCWLPQQISPVIKSAKLSDIIDGNPIKKTVPCEKSDRDWRADPEDGLRPIKSLRNSFKG